MDLTKVFEVSAYSVAGLIGLGYGIKNFGSLPIRPTILLLSILKFMNC